MTAKEEILSRIRKYADGTPTPAPRDYRQSAPADLDLFEARLQDYGVRVYRCTETGLDTTIALAMSNAGKTDLLKAGLTLDYAALNTAQGVLTGCAVAVAETGSIFLRHTESEGGRALTLIPDYHLCIVRANQVVATVPEAIRIAATFTPAPITTISGPSATSDIEMTRVKGVHGPRTLEVILVTS